MSVDGGVRPKWSRDGRELFFRIANRMMAARIDPGSTFTTSAPRPLFEADYAPPYDVAPDGRFLMIRDDQPTGTAQLRLVVNWFGELTRLTPNN